MNNFMIQNEIIAYPPKDERNNWREYSQRIQLNVVEVLCPTDVNDSDTSATIAQSSLPLK